MIVPSGPEKSVSMRVFGLKYDVLPLDEQRTYILGKIYERRKKRYGGDRKNNVYIQVDKLSTWFGGATTAKEIAQQAKTNEKTVRRAAEFAKAVDEIKKASPIGFGVLAFGRVSSFCAF